MRALSVAAPIVDLRVTPQGHALVDVADGAPAALARVAEEFAQSTANGLLFLVGEALKVDVPVGLSFARDFARRYITRLCQTAGAEVQAIDPPGPEDLAFVAMAAPPIVGAEYLSADVLGAWWRDVDALARGRIAHEADGLNGFLESLHPSWHAVGRVTFHLAENKRDPELPFAFLATYTVGIAANGKPQHVPLSRALQQYSDAKDKPALLKLLQPVSNATVASAWAKTLVESGQVYRPLAWEPKQAYQFLSNVPALESSGLTVRVPDWWQKRQASRPMVSVKVGSKPKNTLGIDALLDFNVQVTLGDHSLTQEELDQLLNATDHLIQIRGQWVEIDNDRLAQALQHWRKIEQTAEDGISFVEGMRLLSGMPRQVDEAKDTPIDHDWVGIKPGEWLGETLKQLREPSESPAPSTLHATLRPYQAKGVQWLRFMTQLQLGACLADDMGLGKTVQVIALLLHLRVSHDPARPVPGDQRASLLVVPASLIPNWRAELARFAPSLSAFVAHSSEADVNDPKLADQFDRHDLVITTYTMLARLDALREHQWRLVVLDEAQAIKNAGARQSKAAKQIKADMRVALSGTPIENRLSDLWSLFDFLNPGLLGSAKAFAGYAKKANENDSRDRYVALRRLVQPYILRRMKTDRSIIADLPDKTEMKSFCTLSKQQAKIYQQAVDRMTRELDEMSEGIQRRGLVLAYLMRFKQICNHPAQFLGDGDFDAQLSGKFGRLGEICEELAERQQRVLVFTQFREMTDPIAAYLATVFRRPGLVLHGSTAIKQRKTMVEQFQRDDGPPFFVLSIKAGGTGLNLTAAANVIHFDRWWNPAVENQATDRAFRIGQKQNVLVHKFICKGTVEERIDALIEEKVGLSTDILGGEHGAEKLLTEMNDRDLLNFVSLDLRRATDA